MENKRTAALDYHEFPTPGKVATVSTKPCATAKDLSLAYSPGVSEPCLAIAANEADVYRYTSKGNLVAVISNGTAVLGLGDIGPSASKPVMEGKGVLFKMFAGIDVFDLEVNSTEVEEFVTAIAALAPSFGGINLEDIKAPECFEIEQKLQARVDIPVFHDDQHGTAIIAGAAFLNAIEIADKKIENVRLVISGAGAAAIACARLLLSLGLRKENLLLCDTTGVVYKGRTTGMNTYKEQFAVETSCRTLADAMKDADAFFGLSKKGVVTPEMLLSMAKNPIVFAMANPDPEIDYPLAKATRKDVILATGRSDYPNQVNNVLGFPFIFRGALDVRAKSINEKMKLAAVTALADLAKQPVPESVKKAYGNTNFSFGPDYLIPKPFDPRVLYSVAPAVAKAAMDSGLARVQLDLNEYVLELMARQNPGRAILKKFYAQVRKAETKRIAFSEGANRRVLKAAAMLAKEKVARPILVGKQEKIEEEARKLGISLEGMEVVDPASDPRAERYVSAYHDRQHRRGATLSDAERALHSEHVFATTMLSLGDVDGLICGVDRHYSSHVKTIVDIVGLRAGTRTAAGMHIVQANGRILFFADTTINIETTSEKLAEIATLAADFATAMGVTPRVALLSLSNFGSVRHPLARMVRRAKEMVAERYPGLQIDGEMHADVATATSLMEEEYRFCSLDGPANVLVFPDMQSGNIAYKLVQRLAGAAVVGPVLLGLKAPAYTVLRHATVDDIFNMAIVCARQAGTKSDVSLLEKLVTVETVGQAEDFQFHLFPGDDGETPKISGRN